jgi:hypothetical protein
MEKPNRNLLPPPQMLPHGELRPVIEPPLRDLPPFVGPEMVEEWQPFASHSVESHLMADLALKAHEVAMKDERVKQRLTDKQCIPIGISLLENRDDPKAASLMYVFYNYTDNLAIEVFLDRTTQKIIDIVDSHYQPPPLQEEIEHAITLARQDSRLAERLTDDLEGTAILVSPIDPDSPYCFHRQFDVRFGSPDERLPRYMALVDMSMRKVLKAGPVCRHELRNQEGDKR